MVDKKSGLKSNPLVSIIIAVYNDWEPLNACLRSLAEQSNTPELQVIVIDDGSKGAAPEAVLAWSQSFELTVLRQPHRGIASARNRGVQISRGSVFLFVDADCRFQKDCLASLASAIINSPQHNCFQLQLSGDCTTLVGRVEQLRLLTLQKHMRQPDGRIRYLNTAGFAIRRARADIDHGVFDPMALRAEDTLLLVNLMQAGELPIFVTDAVIQHAIPLSLVGCFLKDVRSAYLEIATYEIIASKGVRIRVTHAERLEMLRSMWKSSAEETIGRSAWFVLTARQGLRWMVSLICRALPSKRSTAGKAAG